MRAHLKDIIAPDTVNRAILDGKRALADLGVEVESPLVTDLLLEHGAAQGPSRHGHGVVLIPAEMVDRCVQTVPEEIEMYDRNGDLVAKLGGDNTYFNPGSCATHYFDCREGVVRSSTEEDLTKLTRVTDALPHIHMASTAMIVPEAPDPVQDAYRLGVVLKNTKKPVVTGTFHDNAELMKELLVAVRGSEEALREKPLAIFDCCPSPALKWAKIWSEDLITLGKYGIPAEFISMPQPGLSAPACMYDCLVQHTAETLSGVVISQSANPGAPMIYGGSPTMGLGGVALLGDVGTAILDASYIVVAKRLGLPCQAYLGLSDSKQIDVQSGYEKGLTLLAAALLGTNNISGPGMFDNENCQSAEMLVLDNEVCGGVLRFLQGVTDRGTDPVANIQEMIETGVCTDTVRFLRDGEFYHSTLANQQNLKQWQAGGKSMLDAAIDRTDAILAEHEVAALDADVTKAIDDRIAAHMK